MDSRGVWGVARGTGGGAGGVGAATGGRYNRREGVHVKVQAMISGLLLVVHMHVRMSALHM